MSRDDEPVQIETSWNLFFNFNKSNTYIVYYVARLKTIISEGTGRIISKLHSSRFTTA